MGKNSKSSDTDGQEGRRVQKGQVVHCTEQDKASERQPFFPCSGGKNVIERSIKSERGKKSGGTIAPLVILTKCAGGTSCPLYGIRQSVGTVDMDNLGPVQSRDHSSMNCIGTNCRILCSRPFPNLSCWMGWL